MATMPNGNDWKPNPRDRFRMTVILVALLGSAVVVLRFRPPPSDYSATVLRWSFACAIAVIVVLLAIPRVLTLLDKWHTYYGSTSLGVAFISFVVIYWNIIRTGYPSIGHPINSDYFSTAAQVLPVVLLAVVVDARRPGNKPLELLETAAYVLVVAAGEFWALHALAFQELTEPFPFAVVCASIFGGLAGLTILVFSERVRSSTEAQSGAQS